MSGILYRSTAYVWFDTEYSTLDLDRAHLLQVAAIVTDPDLNRLFPETDDLNVVVRLPDEAPLSPWIVENTPELAKACRSDLAVTVADVDRRLAALLDRVNVPGGEDKRRPILAGNSVHADWHLARRCLPQFCRRLHYRHLDVTALKLQWQDWKQGAAFAKDDVEQVRTFFPGGFSGDTERRHDALYDVMASIAELNFYRHHFFGV